MKYGGQRCSQSLQFTSLLARRADTDTKLPHFSAAAIKTSKPRGGTSSPPLRPPPPLPPPAPHPPPQPQRGISISV